MTRALQFLTRGIVYIVSVAGLLSINGYAQYGGSGGGTSGGGGTTGGGATSGAGVTSVYNFHGNYHVGFDSPEGWGLKYFDSTTLLNGLQPPEGAEGHRLGSLNVSLE